MSVTLAEKTILLVHPCSLQEKFILENLKKSGLKIVCLNRDIPDFASEFVDYWIIADLNNPEECIQKVEEFQNQRKEVLIGGALTFWEECTPLVSRIIDHFNWIGIPCKINNEIKNKFSFREKCSQYNIPAPLHQMLHSKDDVTNLDPKLSFPLVIKPVYGACSAFVSKVEDKNELIQSFNKIKEDIHTFWLAPEWPSFDILVEQ